MTYTKTIFPSFNKDEVTGQLVKEKVKTTIKVHPLQPIIFMESMCDEFIGVKLQDKLGNYLIRVNNKSEVDATHFYLANNEQKIFVDSSHLAELMTIEYYSIGGYKFSDKLIATQYDESNTVTETLNDIITKGRASIDFYNATGSAIQLQDDLETTIVQANSKIIEGESTITNIETAIVNGDISTVKSDIVSINSSLLDGVQSIRKFGVNGDGTDETIKIQNALNSCVGKILFWNKQLGSYYLTGQLFIPSNITIIFEPNTSVKAIDTLIQTIPAESLFTAIDVENIIIEGNNSTLFMDKSKYFSEFTHCLKLNSVCNVTVNNMNFNTSGGDGIYVGSGGQLRTSSERVKLYNCVCDGNRRQGLSICSASEFVAYNCEFNNTIGTLPECGVDIEPNSNKDRLNNIRFVKCKASGNNGRGFMVALIDHTILAESTDITFEDCCTTSNVGGYFVHSFLRGTRGEIKFINCKAELERLYGFYESLCNGKTLYKDCLAYNCNTSNYVNQGNNAYGSSYHIYANDTGSMKGGNVIFDNCTSLDDRDTKLIRYGFTIGSVNNVIPTNIKMLNCKVDGAASDNYGISPLATGIQIENTNPPVKSFTRTGTIPINHLGHIINNAGATVPRTLTLPIAKDGYRYDIYIEKSFGLTIVPATGGQILALTSAINKSINSVNVGSSIALKGRSDGNWDVIGIIGTWTEVV